jgi:hypothetical protein
MRYISFAALLAMLLIWGCGGTNNLTTNTTGATTGSAFAGNYSGVWIGAPSGNSGTMTLAIATNGAVAGNFNANGSSGAISGSIAGTGAFQAQATFPTGVDTLVGALLLNGTTLSGSLLSQGKVNEQINVTVSEISKP